ncbi:N-6 DNA methylase [Candidatus Pacearchaeota archaeon]|nr:N-6 DNA methylase [Candidatus Pacearchaeota archaeon]
MTTKEEAKLEVEKIVRKFSLKSKSELDSMPEEDIKFQFIEPLFEALGWNREDISKEKRVLKGRADYILRIGNQESLVVEAKKTNVSLSEDEGRQAVSYAYHRKIKFSVLTNFKYFRVYHALSNIKNIDKNLLFWLEFKDFEKEFDKLWLISRESFEKQEINKLLSKKDEKQFVPVDESILADLLEIRRLLSNDLKKLRNYLTDEQIDEAIQILIDRLIFMRSAEDRGLENQNFLLGLVKDSREGRLKVKLWPALDEQFKIFDKSYNSKLFSSGILEDEKNIFLDDENLEKIIKILYFGVENKQSRYMFDEIPGDLLGSIYEQYLGVVLRGTEQRVKLDSESGKRKKMGIYYTPSYIVDYIVKNTVGEYVKDKSIDEILEVRIVDPACGSGSFLIRAFQEVCDAVEEKMKRGDKSKNSTFKNYEDRLNLAQKITILSRCVYGVDLDEKAVELAQLNLLLKLLEGETRETRKLLLPNLKNNIKN